MSIFVNPLQFGPREDLDRYPRPLEADLEVCREEGVELVFLPGLADMYPEGADTTITPGPLGEQLEGAVRPGHFAGVLTVVAKLFHIVAPGRGVLRGEGLPAAALMRRMVRDLDFPLAVVGVPTVREPDGLALSSRNAYLSADDRPRAATLHRALRRRRPACPRPGPDAVLDAARAVLAEEPALAVDYLELRDADLGPDAAGGIGPAAGRGPDGQHPADRQHAGPAVGGATVLLCVDVGNTQIALGLYPDAADDAAAADPRPDAGARLADAHRPADDRRRARGGVRPRCSAGTHRRSPASPRCRRCRACCASCGC